MARGFWELLPRPFSVLAPMANVTDVVFRSIVAQCARPDVLYTEFVSAHGLASKGRDALLIDLALESHEHPIVAQFFGTHPDHIHDAAQLAQELGFDGVDINMGCPDRAVLKQGAGGALIGTPALAQQLVEAARAGASRLPITVKTRLGLRDTEEYRTWIPRLLEAKPDVLVIHGRTVRELSKVPAHWDAIEDVAVLAHQAGVLCVGNGDIASRSQGEGYAQLHGVDGYMVGRGIFHDPWLFAGPSQCRQHSPRERIELALSHTKAWVGHWGQKKSFDVMKKFYKIYIADWPGAAHVRARCFEASTPDEAAAYLHEALEALERI